MSLLLMAVLAAGPVVPWSADPKNCGEPANVCTFAHGVAGCAEGRCQLSACVPSFGDCDADPGTGCESDLASDASNCGGCGKSCGGAPCLQGRCAQSPVLLVPSVPNTRFTADARGVLWAAQAAGEVVDFELPQGPARRLAGGMDGPELVAASGAQLLVGSVSRLWLVPRAGGPARQVGAGTLNGDQLRSLIGDAHGFVVATKVFGRQSPGQLYAVSPEGTVTSLTSGLPGTVCGLALTEKSVFVRTFMPDKILELPRGGGGIARERVTLHEEQCSDLALANDELAYVDFSDPAKNTASLYALPLGGGAPRLLAKRPGIPQHLTAWGDRLVWSEFHLVPNSPDRELRYDVLSLAEGGKVERLASEQDGLTNLAAAGEHLFWILAPTRPQRLPSVDGGVGPLVFAGSSLQELSR